MIDNAMCRDMLTSNLKFTHKAGDSEVVMRTIPQVVQRLEAYEKAVRDLEHLLAEEAFPQYNPNTGESCLIVGVRSVNKILRGVPTVR